MSTIPGLDAYKLATPPQFENDEVEAEAIKCPWCDEECEELYKVIRNGQETQMCQTCKEYHEEFEN